MFYLTRAWKRTEDDETRACAVDDERIGAANRHRRTIHRSLIESHWLISSVESMPSYSNSCGPNTRAMLKNVLKNTHTQSCIWILICAIARSFCPRPRDRKQEKCCLRDSQTYTCNRE